MRSRTDGLLLAALLAAAFGGCRDLGPERIVEGDAPALSRDGKRLAFQRAENRQMHLGVIDLRSRQVNWLVRGDTENACHPAWSRDGTLVYSYANITNTAYQRFCVKGGPQDGYGLRLWKDGVTRELTHGLWRDYMPSFSPDGRKVYFCTQRDATNVTDTTGVRQRIDVMPCDGSSSPKPFICPPVGDAAVGQPVVSPDGRLVAWAELGCVGDTWHLKAAPVEDVTRDVQVTPVRMSAYAPNWLPDSRHLVFTGFLKGDPGWCVYVMDVKTGALRRLAQGTDPCASTDGRDLYYADDGWIWRRALARETMPVGASVDIDVSAEPERVTASLASVTNHVYHPTPKGDYGRDKTLFCRLTADFDGTDKFQPVFFGGYRTASMGLMLFFKGGHAYFATRDIHDTAFAVSDPVRLEKGRHRLTGIRGGDGVVYLSVDGRPPVSLGCSRGVIACDGPAKMDFFPLPAETAGRAITDFQIGGGWPANVPRPRRRSDLFRREGEGRRE